jgi:hypothetical protein
MPQIRRKGFLLLLKLIRQFRQQLFDDCRRTGGGETGKFGEAHAGAGVGAVGNRADNREIDPVDVADLTDCSPFHLTGDGGETVPDFFLELPLRDKNVTGRDIPEPAIKAEGCRRRQNPAERAGAAGYRLFQARK